jgi:cytochrome P450
MLQPNSASVLADLTDLRFLGGDRREVYFRMLKEFPVLPTVRADGRPSWMLSRHSDVQRLLRRPQTRVNPAGSDSPEWIVDGPTYMRIRGSIGHSDPPNHGRLRGVVGPMFLPRRLEAVRATAAASVSAALADLEHSHESFDAVMDLAAQVPKGVICHMLGIPDSDWASLIAAHRDFLLVFAQAPLTSDERTRLDKVVVFYLDYFERLIEQGDPNDRPELVSRLIEAENSGQISRTDTLSLMHTVLSAGHETTRTSISNSIELLAAQPELMVKLRAAPELVDNAVEEFLRILPPIHTTYRVLVEPFEAVDGTLIPPDSFVVAMIGPANLDETVFAAPDRVDIRRPEASRHQSFGGGMHHCLGAPLARIQLQETLKGIVSTFSSVELTDGAPERFPDLMFPSLKALPVRAIA